MNNEIIPLIFFFVIETNFCYELCSLRWIITVKRRFQVNEQIIESIEEYYSYSKASYPLQCVVTP